MAKLTSRVFATWQALYELLRDASWSPHPVTQRSPSIVFGDTDEILNEAVVVVGVPATDVAQAWVTMGQPSKQETFTLRLIVGTKEPGMNREGVFARLEELCDVVQNTLRSDVNGKPTGGFSTALGTYVDHQVSAIRPQLFATDEGFAGYAEVDISFSIRI